MPLPERHPTEAREPYEELVCRLRAESDARYAKAMAESDRQFRLLRWMLWAAVVLIIVLNVVLWTSPLDPG